MAGSFLTGALLLPVLLAAQTLARHAPPACPCSAGPAVEAMYTSPTNDGPSPATGHGNQPSPRMAQQDGGAASGGDPGVSAASESKAPATFSGNYSTAPDESPRNVSRQRNTAGAGVGNAPGVRA